jgi:hypothetical protein
MADQSENGYTQQGLNSHINAANKFEKELLKMTTKKKAPAKKAPAKKAPAKKAPAKKTVKKTTKKK